MQNSTISTQQPTVAFLYCIHIPDLKCVMKFSPIFFRMKTVNYLDITFLFF
jgi:hypothetical protein